MPRPTASPQGGRRASWLPDDWQHPVRRDLPTGHHLRPIRESDVYVDPPEKLGADADVSWWVVDDLVGSPVEDALDRDVPEWLAQEWPFGVVRYPGRELTWAEWAALPDHPEHAAQPPGETSPAS